MKSPAFQFYPGDWRRDLPLRYCSLEARGLWIELMCLMHDGTPYGHLATEHEAITEPVLIAKLVGATPTRVKRGLDELTKAGVLSTTEAGVIYSRRMVRDEEVRGKRRAGGYQSIGHPSTHPPKDPTRVPLLPPFPPPSRPPLGVPPASAVASAPAPASASKKHPETTGARIRPGSDGLSAKGTGQDGRIRPPPEPPTVEAVKSIVASVASRVGLDQEGR